MDKLYIIAHNWEGIELTIETYFTSLKVMKRLGELLEEYPIKPNPEDDPEEFLSSYYQWLNYLLLQLLNQLCNQFQFLLFQIL